MQPWKYAAETHTLIWKDQNPLWSEKKQIMKLYRDFPGGPVVKNPPSNSGEADWIPGQGTNIPHAAGQLSPHATTAEPSRLN